MIEVASRFISRHSRLVENLIVITIFALGVAFVADIWMRIHSLEYWKIDHESHSHYEHQRLTSRLDALETTLRR